MSYTINGERKCRSTTTSDRYISNDYLKFLPMNNVGNIEAYSFDVTSLVR